MLEATLGDAANEFFFGCNVSVKLDEQDIKERKNSNLPQQCKTPTRVLTYRVEMEEGEVTKVKIKVYRQRPKIPKRKRLAIEGAGPDTQTPEAIEEGRTT